jgi:hypothetical protein
MPGTTYKHTMIHSTLAVLIGLIAFCLPGSAADCATVKSTAADEEVAVNPGLKPAKPIVMTKEQLGQGVPNWVKDTLPDWIEPYVGRKGLPAPWCKDPGILATGVGSFDRWQANRFIVYRPETARFVYRSYTPLKVKYRSGTCPSIEAAAARQTRDCKSDTERLVSLLTGAMSACRHPTVPPKGPAVRADRNLSEEDLYRSGCAWCNEQARVFIRMCQVCGLPGRIVHLFYSDKSTGHTIAEIFADGRWIMADASYLVVFPGPDGKLMSAAECHEKNNHAIISAVYHQRLEAVAKMSDAELGMSAPEAAKFRKESGRMADYVSSLDGFAVINNPLPSERTER